MTNEQMTNDKSQILNRPSVIGRWLLISALLLAGCGGKAASLVSVFPGADAFPGWTPTGEVEVFDREDIYDLVDGQAEAFFAYGFEQVAVRRYENAEGAALHIEAWQLATPADAYGLFTAGIAGESADIGNDGDADPGRRLAFWQDRYTRWWAGCRLMDWWGAAVSSSTRKSPFRVNCGWAARTCWSWVPRRTASWRGTTSAVRPRDCCWCSTPTRRRRRLDWPRWRAAKSAA
jgi:hypothetical protein